jgi:hypothetical protein
MLQSKEAIPNPRNSFAIEVGAMLEKASTVWRARAIATLVSLRTLQSDSTERRREEKGGAQSCAILISAFARHSPPHGAS